MQPEGNKIITVWLNKTYWNPISICKYGVERICQIVCIDPFDGLGSWATVQRQPGY